ncbi:alpha-ketoglutaric semialdehyde dehydrogenase GucD [Lysinibacillus telephonicus]|uniref:alpha-ketoglutaric semialdehyde dehydrogenase GucD n=1 Tax=Lysinibacillus telephonicus TaxID=1714840 RepID=UPI003D154AC0
MTNEILNYIDGKWSKSSSGNVIESINPSTLQVVGRVQNSTREEVELAVNAASAAKKEWHQLGQFQRGQILYKVAENVEKNKEDIAKTLSDEMGKTYPEALGETERGVAILRYYASEGSRKDGDVIPASDNKAIMFTKRAPLGVVGVITPWNFPVAIPLWKIAPALIYGNTVVFKPASEAAVTAAKIVQCFDEANIPNGVLNFITGSGSSVGDALINNQHLNGITFTGSSSTGKLVAEAATKNGVKFQLEMGGKNPVIVLADANLDNAVAAVLSGGFKSTGQKCTATSRVIVESSIYETFKNKLLEEASKISINNDQKQSWMGPCASESQYNTVLDYIAIGKEEGAKLIFGGNALKSEELKGFYVEPAVFEDVTANMRIAQEEIFGPVIALMKADSLEEAIDIANDVAYGLSASIFTKNLGSAMTFIDQIEAGLVRVNAESAGVEFQAPFGGVKASSTGVREQGEAAKEFYTLTKTVFLKSE